MRIDHIGYAVRDICQAIKEFRKLGFSFEDIVDDPDRNLYIAFGENGGYRIELVSPRNKGGGGLCRSYFKAGRKYALSFLLFERGFRERYGRFKSCKIQGDCSRGAGIGIWWKKGCIFDEFECRVG